MPEKKDDTENKIFTAIGLMSGTSMDGIDVALIKTDGKDYIEHIDSTSVGYIKEVKALIRECLNPDDTPIMKIKVKGLEEVITRAHAHAVLDLMRLSNNDINDIDLIGFHGHTISHNPQDRKTHQVGDGAMLARLLKCDVINDFRSADVQVGGQGAPLVPVYHKALAKGFDENVAFLNIGGVANVTWVGTDGKLVAFDTGPGNALIDDWILRKTVMAFDNKGKTARQGKVHSDILDELMSHDYFTRPAPKSLDRNEFSAAAIKGKNLSVEDGAATLTAFTVRSISRSIKLLPKAPKKWIVCGGGRHNDLMMEWLEKSLKSPVVNVDDLGLKGDMLEAEAFGYMAVRSKLGLPISFPETTGVPAPMIGGVLHEPAKG